MYAGQVYRDTHPRRRYVGATSYAPTCSSLATPRYWSGDQSVRQGHLLCCQGAQCDILHGLLWAIQGLFLGPHRVGGGQRHADPQGREDCDSGCCYQFREEEHGRIEGYVRTTVAGSCISRERIGPLATPSMYISQAFRLAAD